MRLSFKFESKREEFDLNSNKGSSASFGLMKLLIFIEEKRVLNEILRREKPKKSWVLKRFSIEIRILGSFH